MDVHAVIWEYDVRPQDDAAFVALYGADGAWTALFREHRGYAGTELLRDERVSGRYLTIDRWASAADYDAFLASRPARYADLDRRGDALTVAERLVGRYTTT